MISSSSIPTYLLLLVLVGRVGVPLLHAELSDAQKRELFLNSHHAGASPTPSHPIHKTPLAHSSETHHSPAGASPSHSGNKKTHPLAVHSQRAHAVHHESLASLKSPSTQTVPLVLSPAEPASHSPVQPLVSNPAPSVIVTPTSAPTVAPAASEAISLPHGAAPSAPITIEKSGVEQAQGLEPAPESHGLFGWLFGGGPHRSYNYLSASTRSAIDRAPVRRGRWKYIIVHNSGTREGNARIFDIYHLRVRHMKNGLAYHFVIGDGHGSGDGQIEIGHRWTAQLNGGHVASDYLNDISLGICLVGDFNRDLPTKAQIGALEELIECLRDRVGKTQGRRAIIYAHKEINPRPTDCPGDRFPYSWLHAKFQQGNR